MKKVIAVILLLILLPAVTLADLEVHFLDVGQGDCTIILCDGESMVIDGGPRSANSKLHSYLRNTLKIWNVNYAVSTHPHLDHVYGISTLLNTVQVDVVLTPVLEWDSDAFGYMLKYAKMQGTPLSVPQVGETFPLGGATVTVLNCWPEGVAKGRTNDTSIVLRIDYGKTSFIVTGDAEDWAEYMMLDTGLPLKADVLRVAHHGSSYSSTPQFLEAVKPTYAVISCGKDNPYGHPHPETLARLDEVGSTVLRTDRLGTIVMNSDGETITWHAVKTK